MKLQLLCAATLTLAFCPQLFSSEAKTTIASETKADKSTSKTDSMTSIKSWKDVTPFAGRVIAVQSKSSYFNFIHGECFLLNDSPLFYGLVNKESSLYRSNTYGYGMAPILKTKGTPAWCTFTDKHIQDDVTLSIRLATKEEIEQFIAAVESDKAEIAYTFSKDAALKALNNSK